MPAQHIFNILFNTSIDYVKILWDYTIYFLMHELLNNSLKLIFMIFCTNVGRYRHVHVLSTGRYE